jgi:hypothetical protein
MDVTIADLFEDAEEAIMFLMTLLLKPKADAFIKRKC